MTKRRAALAGLAVALLAGGVGLTIARVARDEGDDGPSPSRRAADRPCAEGAATYASRPLPPGSVVVRRVGSAIQPTAAVFDPDGSGDGLLAERGGRVRRVARGELTDDVVLDLSDDTMQEGDGGLLALAYAPDGRWLYAYRADGDHDDVLSAYPLDGDGHPDRSQERVLLRVDHPESVQHHGGGLVVGADELLYLGLGDGGGLGDPGEHAQDPTVLLGKVLRLAPTPDAAEPYRIPPDNPFVDDPRVAPEIWLLGARNPYRLSQDPATGDFWLGDVGQTCWEEIDRLPTGADGVGGGNLGWDHVEGTHRFEGGAVPGRRVDPVLEHPHADGWCGIVAGYVPRASAVPELDGRLLYTDYCKGDVLALAVDDGAGPALVEVGVRAENPIAIVPGPGGHPWVLTLAGEVLELTAG